jgi:hypothetical protein
MDTNRISAPLFARADGVYAQGYHDSPHLFATFAKIIDSFPAGEILKAIELEHLMLEENLLYKRVVETEDTDSILFFCQFVNAVVDEDNILFVELPVAHVTFYRKTLRRLIDAGELGADAMKKFDLTFSSEFARAFARN